MPLGNVASALVLTLSTFSCTHDVTNPPPTGSESSAVKPAAADPSTPPASEDITFNLVYPAGYNIGQVAVGASGSLSLGSNDVILGADGKPGTVTSAGTGATSLSPSVQAGDVVSVPDISISPKDTVTSARSAGKVSVGSNAKVGTVQQQAALTPLVQRTVTVHPPSGPSTDVDVSKKSPVTLAAGRYGQVTVGPDATLKLSAGTYLFDSFSVGPKSIVDLDTRDGTVNVYVNQSADWKGALAGDASRFVFGYLGTGTVHLTGMFRGTALAPNGGLKIELEGASNEGTFYGKDVTVGPNITIKKLGTPFLIGELKVGKTDLCVGEQTEVSLATTGAPGTTTRIMGTPGDHQFVQFANAPGNRLVYATVETADGKVDFVQIPVTVRACPEEKPTVAMHFWGDGGNPNGVEFMVRRHDEKGHEAPVAQPATFTWDFGDGTKTTTTTPLVTHNYSDAVDALKEYNYFTVSVSVTNSQGTMITKKVVPVWSLYAKNRSKGIIQPPSTVSFSLSNYAVQVKNHEPTPIAITAARTDFIPCDTNQDVQPQPVQAMNVAVPASATGTVNVAPPATIPDEVCALGIHLMGTAPSGTVYSDSYVRIKENPQLQQQVTDPDTIALLNEASAVTQDPNQFDGQELRTLVAAGKLAALPPAMPPPASWNGASAVPAKAAAATIVPMAETVASTTPKAGDTCTPGDVSHTPGLVCQPTPDWVAEFGQFVNASKGYIVMDHGCGKIGKLLGAINQHYSHTVIMAQNRVGVRHSTASEDRASASLDYSKLRLDGDVLRYGYPGTAGKDTYTVNQIVTEYYVTDPNGKDRWRMGSEITPNVVTCSDENLAVPTLVVRPPPDAPADLQKAVASMADPKDGALFTTQGHYRFFMYTHADKASLYPGEGWATETGADATVCSLFALDAASRTQFAGQSLRLRPSFQGVSDGMQSYTIDQRLAAAKQLYANTSNSVADECELKAEGGGGLLGGLIGGLIGGPAVGIAAIGVLGGKTVCDHAEDNIANQLTNCFAFDACADTSDTWKSPNPGTGIAVSPDNILDWDVPSTQKGGDGTYNGTYGYNEPLAYLPAMFRHRYAWTRNTGTGAMSVHVVNENGDAFPGADIFLDMAMQGATDAYGNLNFPVLATGKYIVEAQYNPCEHDKKEPLEDSTPPSVPLYQLQACPDSGDLPQDGCYVKTPRACPGNYSTGDCKIQNSDGGVETLCGCYPKPTCNTLIRGSVPTEVKVDQTTPVTIRLCSNGTGACPQLCNTDLDCDNTQACNSNGKCSPIHQVVQISVPEIDGLVHDSCDALPKDLGVSFTVECDPQSEENMTDWICDDKHLDFCRDPITGGHAYADVDLHDNGHCNYMKFSFVCTMDEETGGVKVGADVRLLKGCGAEAEDEGNSVQWRALVVPATRDNPNPAPLVCRGETETTQGTCEDYLWFFTWHDEDNPFTCHANNAAFYKGGISYRSLPRP